MSSFLGECGLKWAISKKLGLQRLIGRFPRMEDHNRQKGWDFLENLYSFTPPMKKVAWLYPMLTRLSEMIDSKTPMAWHF